MLYYKIGDLLKAQQIYIAHQVNCQGVMGAGGVPGQLKKNILKPINSIKKNV